MSVVHLNVKEYRTKACKAGIDVPVVYSVSFLTPYIFNKEGVGLYSDFGGVAKLGKSGPI
jgi:hypothetical protein